MTASTQRRNSGFTAVEYLFPYEHPPEAIAVRLARNGLTQALFNLPPGDWSAGERGLAALPGRLDEIMAGTERALAYAEATGAKRLHLMSGLGQPSDAAAAAIYRRAVAATAERLANAGIDLPLEPINRRDMPGYFLSDFAIAEALIAELGLPNLKLQFDIYHRQILHGDVTMALRRLMPMIGHVQIASVPARNEPDGGESATHSCSRSWTGLATTVSSVAQYRPLQGTREGLGWFKPFAGNQAKSCGARP